MYLPNLNGLRCIAALLVLFHHVEQLRQLQGWSNWYHIPFFESVGKTAVHLFFVLSGFLITYLLVKEKEWIGDISIRPFYYRRILRIWPLYYLVVLLSFFVFPRFDFLRIQHFHYDLFYQNFEVALLLFGLFLSNFFLIYYGFIPHVTQVWSIGIEEQFYLIWPWLLKYAPSIPRIILYFIINYNLLRVVFKLLNSYGYIERVIYFPPIDCLAIGGLFAVVSLKQIGPDWLADFFQNRIVQWVNLCLILFIVGSGIFIPFIHFQLLCALFGVMILGVVSPRSILNFENEAMNYLGKISYGIYMYHPVVIAASINLGALLHNQSSWLTYSLSISGTIALASISYQYYERPFIRWKGRFSFFKSGDEARYPAST